MKQTLITEEKVLEELKSIIAETLRVDRDTIQPEMLLVKDLGAESLDFLDINYQLEQKFGIKMARNFVLEHMEEMFGEGSALDENGRLTPKAVEVMKIRFGPNTTGLRAGMDTEEVPSIITVLSIVKAVIDMLNSLPEKCSRCGKSTWKTEDGTHTKCGSCGEEAAFANGDELTKEWLKKVQEEKKIFPV